MCIQNTKVNFPNEDEVIVAGFVAKITSIKVINMSTFKLTEQGRMTGQRTKNKVKMANLVIL